MGLLFVESLPGPKVFKCKFCGVDSASRDAIVSKEFRGRHGRAYLFDSVVNVSLGPNEDRYLMTGLHTVNDIYCSCCQRRLGWRYARGASHPPPPLLSSATVVPAPSFSRRPCSSTRPGAAAPVR